MAAAASASAARHRFWRMVITGGSDTGWEAYIGNLSMFDAGGRRLERPRRIWCRRPLDAASNSSRNALRALPAAAAAAAPSLPATAGGSAASHVVPTAGRSGERVLYRTEPAPALTGDFLAWEYSAPEAVARVTFDQWGSAGNAVTALALQWSDDGSAWTTAAAFCAIPVTAFDSAACRREHVATADALMAEQVVHVAETEDPRADAEALAALQARQMLAQATMRAAAAAARSPPQPLPAGGELAVFPQDGAARSPLRGVMRLHDYVQNIAGGATVTVLCGSRVALVLGDDVWPEFGRPIDNFGAMASIIGTLERLHEVYADTVGRIPALPHPVRWPPPRAVEGSTEPGESSPPLCLIPYEIAYIDAGGLAHHGVAGSAIGPGFLAAMYRAAVARDPYLHHVFFYETTRNYIFPEEFTALFDYHALAEPPESTGWVNQGFVNVLGCLLAPQLPARFEYFGQDRASFMAGMEAQFERYQTGGYTWEDVFCRERLPWDQDSSLDNVYSGLLVSLFRAAGGDTGDRGATFLRRWFRVAVPLMLEQRMQPRGKDDVARARENFYYAACIAADADLTDAFTTAYRWPLPHATRARVGALLALARDRPLRGVLQPAAAHDGSCRGAGASAASAPSACVVG